MLSNCISESSKRNTDLEYTQTFDFTFLQREWADADTHRREFDYTMQPAPSIPLIDTTRERRDMWFLKRRGLPALYWNAILPGRA